MKVIPKVDTEGLFLEDTLVDDAFNGVVPFYVEVKTPADSDATEQDDAAPDGDPTEEAPEPVIAGYTVGIPVTPGLYRPRFDLAAWEAYQDAIKSATDAYNDAYAKWSLVPEDERGEPPQYVTPEQPTLWVEGLTPEEIEALHPPQEPTEMELLTAEVAEIKAKTADHQQSIVIIGGDLGREKAGSAELRQISSAIGSEQVKQDLATIDLKQQNTVIGAELVKKDISILDLYMQNQILGQMLAALELKILAGGGKENV